MTLRITSNYRQRAVISFDELPAEAQEQFDYIARNSHSGGYDERSESRFVLAYGSWWDTHEFEALSRGISVLVAAPGEGEPDRLGRWDAISGQSHFHAIVLRYFELDSETPLDGPIVGWAQW